MKRTTFACTVFGMTLPGYYLWQMQSAPPARDMSDMATWQPDAAALQESMNARFGKTITLDNAAARDLFTQIFQQRYREHKPQLAVGIKLYPAGNVRLLVPSRLEPWHINRIALAAYREVQDNFGVSVPVDVYETFVGASPVKVGQARADAHDPQHLRVTFDYSRSPNRTRR
jgi:hypothetical protein